MRLSARLAATADLSASQHEALFALMEQHYVNVHRDHFEADLAEKPWVILVSEPGGERLCGFSTQMLLDVEVDGRAVKALFSGDTIIDRQHWGDQALAHEWGRLALTLIDQDPAAELYWFLLSKGYKTYRFLPVFFREFYPRHDALFPEQTPTWARAVLEALARSRWPGAYDAQVGIVRASPGQYRLRAGLAEVTSGRLRDPHVRFFHGRNPGHARGDELCCLAPLTRTNFTPAAYRVIGLEPVTQVVS